MIRVQDPLDLLFFQDDETHETVMHVACLNGAPLDLIAGTLKAAGNQAPDLCAMMDKCVLSPYACGHDDPAVHKQLNSTQPIALRFGGYLTAADVGEDAVALRPPHQLAASTGRPAAVVSLLTDVLAAAVAPAYGALATLVDGDALEMERNDKRYNIITTHTGWTALHWAAAYHSDTAVFELLVREYPLALFATTSKGNTPCRAPSSATAPPRSATSSPTPPPPSPPATSAPSLPSSTAMPPLSLPPARLAIRVAILICVKRLTDEHTINTDTTTPASSLVRIAHELLPHTMWSEILSFL